MKKIIGGVTTPKGFKVASCEANIKYKNRKDMAMIYSEKPCVCSGTFTTNVVKAACVLWDMDIVHSDKYIQAIVINSGIANACTGKEGYDACKKVAMAVEKQLNIPFDTVAVASTGVIGMQLPIDKLVFGVEQMSSQLDNSILSGTEASKAIMTTDTVNKEMAVSFKIDGKEVKLGAMCKGSGMIHPNMCTMLAFLTTDISIDKQLLQDALGEVVDDTFNMITVDGDTSTNDTVLCLANGMAENNKIIKKDGNYEIFKNALQFVCINLAKIMTSDGEGATKLFEAKVINAKSIKDAKLLSKSIVSSNLSKAAIFGCDANFGRFLCAMGYSGAQFDQNNVELFFESTKGKLKVFDKGVPIEFDENLAIEIMKSDVVTVFVNMNEGNYEATAWGCDLTYDYVKINADYRS